MRARLTSRIAELPTASFSVVMATGIVSLAADLLGLKAVGRVLFGLNGVLFLLLTGQLVAKALFFRERIVAELADHRRAVGYFTVVAGTGVFGNQWVLLAGNPQVGLALWIAAAVLWLLLTYVIFTLLTVGTEKPSLAEGIHGGWLVSVVAAQSVSGLAALLAPYHPAVGEGLLFLSLVVWLGAGALYVWIISLIFYRYTFFPMTPDHLTPPYWINMGAMAISTLAGTFLISRAGEYRLLAELLPFLKGTTLLFWATATWWIPMLLVLGFWRHVLKRVPIFYDPVYWSMVFPLGMYTVATYRLAGAVDAAFLLAVPRVTVYVALAAWGLTMLGLLSLARRIVRE